MNDPYLSALRILIWAIPEREIELCVARIDAQLALAPDSPRSESLSLARAVIWELLEDQKQRDSK